MPPHPGLTTPGGILLVLAVLLPVIGLLIGLVAGGRHARSVALITIAAGLAVALGIAEAVLVSGRAARLRARRLGAAARHPAARRRARRPRCCSRARSWSRASPSTPARTSARARGAPESRKSLAFWLLLLAVWGGLNLVFVTRDLFTGYVALEMLTFAAVPLVCLDGRGETIRAALRYLLFALAGSMLYLLGVFLLYGSYGTVDMALLAERRRPNDHDRGRDRAADHRAARQDRAVPAAPVAAAGALRRPARCERDPVGARGQGLVVPGRAHLARRLSRAS